MAFEALLRGGRVGGMALRNRMLAGPMERGLANRDGSLNQRYIDYVAERARGGAALITLESTYVDARGMGHLYQLGAHGDHVIPGLRRLGERVHAHGAKVALELYMGGRQTPSYMSQRQPVAPSVVRCATLQPVATPRELSLDDIAGIVDAFAAAARRVDEAGLDCILMHGAHGYLLGSFVSPYSNRRTDSYGGTLENRARFPLEVLAAIRAVVGPGFPIGYRMSADEYVEGGLGIEEACQFARLLKDGGIDLIDVSGGVYESADTIIQGPESPPGGFVDNAVRIKQAVGDDLPVSVAQRLNDPVLAERVLNDRGLDFVTLSRAFHADPHFARKIEEGHVSAIRPCIACHHCTNLLEANEPARCAVNPRSTFERLRRIQPVARRRRILVAGGGIAGLQAATILAEEGSEVLLCERAPVFGGQVRLAAKVAPDYARIVDFLVRHMTAVGVEARLNTQVTTTTAEEEGADAVVVATGAMPGLSYWPLDDGVNTLDVFSALERPDTIWDGARVVILGGDGVCCYVAAHALRHGAEVHVVEPGDAFAGDKLSPARNLLLASLQSHGDRVVLRSETTAERVRPGAVILQSHGTFEELYGVDAVVVGGRRAASALYEELVADPEREVYGIGDCLRPRSMLEATHEAAAVAEFIRLRSA